MLPVSYFLMARKVVTDDQRRAERRSTLRGVLIGCGAAVALVLLVVIIIVIRLFQTPALPPEAADTGNLPPAPSLDDQIRQLQAASVARLALPAHLIASQEDLSARLAHEDTGRAGSGISDLKVYVGKGTVAFTGRAKWRGHTVCVTVRGEPTAQNGEMRVRVFEVRVGKVTMPRSVRRAVQGELDDALRQQWPGLRVDSLTATPGRLEAIGITKPQ